MFVQKNVKRRKSKENLARRHITTPIACAFYAAVLKCDSNLSLHPNPQERALIAIWVVSIIERKSFRVSVRLVTSIIMRRWWNSTFIPSMIYALTYYFFFVNFQVFVYDAHGYEAVKRRLSETGWIRSSYMAQLPYLLPLWVKHMGKVMILNSNPHTTQAVREALTIRFLFSVYPNIFKMHDNAELVRRVEKYLNNESDGLLGLELKTLDVVFRDAAKKKWYDESLQQTLQLWEINL